MHVLVLNHHPLQAKFIHRGLRYQNIGADTCHPENLDKIWYGQYHAMVIPLKNWEDPPLETLVTHIQKLGNIPTVITAKATPPPSIEHRLKTIPHLTYVNSHLPFKHLVESLHEIFKKRVSSNLDECHIQIGDLYIDIESRQVKRAHRKIPLRNKEFGLLESLMRNAGKVLTRMYLLENVWDRNTSILSNTVDVHVNRLRKKVDHGFHYAMIQTIPCIGYKMLSENEIQEMEYDKTKI